MDSVSAEAVDLHAGRWTRPSKRSRVATVHRDTGSVLRAAERYHVLTNMRGYELLMMTATVGQDILDEVVAELIASNYIVVSTQSQT